MKVFVKNIWRWLQWSFDFVYYVNLPSLAQLRSQNWKWAPQARLISIAY